MKYPGWFRRSNERRTMCEVCREIYDETIRLEKAGVDEEDLRVVRRRLHELVRIGKRINRRLYEISLKDNAVWWKKNKNYEANLRRRLGYTKDTEAVDEEFDMGFANGPMASPSASLDGGGDE